MPQPEGKPVRSPATCRLTQEATEVRARRSCPKHNCFPKGELLPVFAALQARFGTGRNQAAKRALLCVRASRIRGVRIASSFNSPSRVGARRLRHGREIREGLVPLINLRALSCLSGIVRGARSQRLASAKIKVPDRARNFPLPVVFFSFSNVSLSARLGHGLHECVSALRR